jgi:predicted lipoprotein
MTLRLILAIALAIPLLSGALRADTGAMIADVVDNHILPRMQAFAKDSAALEKAADSDCEASSKPLLDAYQRAFDAWISASHLRFGPTETDNRAFALAFWPDARGMVPKALRQALASSDPVIRDADAFAAASVALRGFFALDYLLFDPAFADLGSPEDRCALIRAVAADLSRTAATIAADWTGEWAVLMKTAGANEVYRTQAEAVQELYKSLYTGLEFTADTRLGQPMGTFDRPRPERAEAWRSGRSLRNIELSLASLRDLADRLAAGAVAQTDLAPQIDYAFGRAIESTEALADPVFAGITDPMARFRVEALQQMLFAIRNAIRGELGPALGVDEGFSLNDGD